MRFTLMLLTMFCLAAGVGAADEAKAAKPDPAVVKAKINKLAEDQKTTAKAMHNLRIKLIKTDPELKKLHDSIMAMHRELALKMSANKDMRKLIIKFEDNEKEIENLKKSIGKK